MLIVRETVTHIIINFPDCVINISAVIKSVRVFENIFLLFAQVEILK